MKYNGLNRVVFAEKVELDYGHFSSSQEEYAAKLWEVVAVTSNQLERSGNPDLTSGQLATSNSIQQKNKYAYDINLTNENECSPNKTTQLVELTLNNQRFIKINKQPIDKQKQECQSTNSMNCSEFYWSFKLQQSHFEMQRPTASVVANFPIIIDSAFSLLLGEMSCVRNVGGWTERSGGMSARQGGIKEQTTNIY